MTSMVLSAVADKYLNWSVLSSVLAGNNVYRLAYVMVKNLSGPWMDGLFCLRFEQCFITCLRHVNAGYVVDSTHSGQ